MTVYACRCGRTLVFPHPDYADRRPFCESCDVDRATVYYDWLDGDPDYSPWETLDDGAVGQYRSPIVGVWP